jgi:hypothetical protein
VTFGQRLAEDEQAGEQDQRADGREEDEEAAPVGDGGELPAEDRADDRGQPGDHGQAAVVPHELAARVEVTARRLGDHDAHPAGQALHETRRDQRGDGGAERTQRRGDDVGDDTDQQRPATAEAVGDRTGDDLSDRQAEQAGGDGQLGGRGRGVQLGRERGQHGQVEVHGDRPENRQQAEHDRQRASHGGGGARHAAEP